MHLPLTQNKGMELDSLCCTVKILEPPLLSLPLNYIGKSHTHTHIHINWHSLVQCDTGMELDSLHCTVNYWNPLLLSMPFELLLGNNTHTHINWYSSA